MSLQREKYRFNKQMLIYKMTLGKSFSSDDVLEKIIQFR